jgi:invasion protein IalB
MDHRIMSAPARLVGRALAVMTATSITAVLTTSVAVAQLTPPPASPTPAAKPAAPKAAPAKPAAPKPAPAKPAEAAKPAPAPPPQAAQAPAAQPGGEQMPQLIYSQWIKFCVKPDDAAGKQICLTGIDGRIESGMPVVAVVVIEPEGDPKKILRITLPVGMHLQHGSRVLIDQNAPLTAPFVVCFNNGCMADYDVTPDPASKKPDIIGMLKKGHEVLVQGINFNGGAISIPVPLTDFAKVFEGPPTDPKILEERQKKLEEELQRKANEARQKLESQQGQPAAPGAAAPAQPAR